MVSADESRPETGPGPINGKAKPSRSKSSGKTTEQRQRKPSQDKQSQDRQSQDRQNQDRQNQDRQNQDRQDQGKQTQGKQVQTSEPTPDALLAATETIPDATQPMEPMEQPIAAAETRDAPAAEVVAEPATTVPVSARTVSDAYGDYTRKSIAQTSSFFAELAGARSPHKAFELQTEFARTAFETFVDESRKIRELHRELAKQRLQNLEGFVMGKRATR